MTLAMNEDDRGRTLCLRQQLRRYKQERTVAQSYQHFPATPSWFEYPDWCDRKVKDLLAACERKLKFPEVPGLIVECSQAGESAKGATIKEIREAIGDSAKRKPQSRLGKTLAMCRQLKEFDGSLSDAILCLSHAEHGMSTEVVDYCRKNGHSIYLNCDREYCQNLVKHDFADGRQVVFYYNCSHSDKTELQQLTYFELFVQLSKATPEQLAQPVMALELFTDEYYPVQKLGIRSKGKPLALAF